MLQDHLETFLARLDTLDSSRSLPRFVIRELRDYLKCGILAHGFCRVHCDSCNRDDVVAFSCKHRGFCPSCGARRMAATAAHLVDYAPADDPSGSDPDLLQVMATAAVQGRTATGERHGARDQRIGRGTASEPFSKGRLCCDLDGFSLHAAVRIPAGLTERIARLCRYAARPPIVLDRLSRTEDGKVVYKLERRFRDGSTHVLFDPHTFLERLCALIPRPRKKLVDCYGIFAPAAGLRDRVVPRQMPDHAAHDPTRCAHDHPNAHDDAPQRTSLQRKRNQVPHAPTRPRNRSPRYYRWAELLRRVFLIDVLTCPHCQGPRRMLAAIFDPDAIAGVLESLGLPLEPPRTAAARPPPQGMFDW